MWQYPLGSGGSPCTSSSAVQLLALLLLFMRPHVERSPRLIDCGVANRVCTLLFTAPPCVRAIKDPAMNHFSFKCLSSFLLSRPVLNAVFYRSPRQPAFFAESKEALGRTQMLLSCPTPHARHGLRVRRSQGQCEFGTEPRRRFHVVIRSSRSEDSGSGWRSHNVRVMFR